MAVTRKVKVYHFTRFESHRRIFASKDEEATTACNTENDRDAKQRKNDRSAGIQQ